MKLAKRYKDLWDIWEQNNQGGLHVEHVLYDLNKKKKLVWALYEHLMSIWHIICTFKWKMHFLTLRPKVCRRMHANVFWSAEIDRTYSNWSKTSSVCPKSTSPSLNRDFLENFIFHDFQLSFSAENEKEKSHFPKLKFWKKCKTLTFTKSCLE